jgi:hypothetical protein
MQPRLSRVLLSLMVGMGVAAWSAEFAASSVSFYGAAQEAVVIDFAGQQGGPNGGAASAPGTVTQAARILLIQRLSALYPPKMTRFRLSA